MTSGTDAPTERSSDDPRAVVLLEKLDAIEARLDPRPVKRGQLIADLVTVGVIGSAGLLLDWHVTHPAVLLAFLVSATGLNRLVLFVARRSLRREREALTAQYDEIAALDHPPGEASAESSTPIDPSSHAG